MGIRHGGARCRDHAHCLKALTPKRLVSNATRSGGQPCDYASNARTTPLVRLEIIKLVEAGASIAELARRFAVCRTTIYEWLRRFRQFGLAGLKDRRSTAKTSPTKVSATLTATIKRLRTARRLLGWQIAVAMSMSRSTVIKVLKRITLARLRDLEPPQIFRRYQYSRPGELVHIDIEKLGRFEVCGHRIHGDRRRRSRAIGSEAVYVAVDDASGRSDAKINDAENATTATAFLKQVVQRYTKRGSKIERVMTVTVGSSRRMIPNLSCGRLARGTF